MFATFNKAVKASQEFWDVVRNGTGISSVNDPRLRLRDALKDCSLSKGNSGGAKTKKKVSSEEVFHWAINAWNAWRENRECKVLKAIINAGRPKVK